MAVNSVLLKIETSNFQEMLTYLYTAVHIERNKKGKGMVLDIAPLNGAQ